MSALKIKDDQGNWINLPGLKGDKGDKGDKGESGVYLGTTAPSDEDINVWINPNGSAHTEAVVVDPTLTMEGQAADAKVVGDAVGEINDVLMFDVPIDFSNYNTIPRYISPTSLMWSSAGSASCYLIPVPTNVQAGKLIVTASANNNSAIAFLTNNNSVVNSMPSYADGTGGIGISAGTTQTFDVPSDCVYLYVHCTSSSGNSFLPDSCTIRTFYDVAATIDSIRIVEDKIISEAYESLWARGDVLPGTSIKASTGDTTPNDDYDTLNYVPISGSILIGKGARYYFYDSEKKAISGATGVLNNNSETYEGSGWHIASIPSNASYFRICEVIDGSKLVFELDAVDDYLLSLITAEVPNERTMYCLGDSITRGMYAESGASSSTGPTAYSYPYWIGKINNYNVVNLGNSGSGWANLGSAETVDDQSVSHNAKDVVDDNTFSDADIITLAYGVNDWKGASQNVVLGDMTSASGNGTVIGNMKYCIEQIVSKKPTVQIIVLLPMNTNRQWSGMDTMTEANNWAFGYAYRNNQTLEDYRDAIRECAEYYNVKVIDLEEVCPINRLNIKNVCGDGLHPTKAFHKQMGMALAPLIH